MRFFATFLAAVLGTLVGLGVLFFLVLVLVAGLAASGEGAPAVRAGSVLTLDLSGALPELAADDPLAAAFGGEPEIDLARVRTALRLAATDRRIRGVWVRTDGLSASWAALEEVRAALERFRRSGKPVFASGMGGGVDEAAYFVLAAADSVYLPPLSPFEFNGFTLQVQFFKRALDRLRVEPQVIRAGVFKAAVEPFLREDLSPENRQQLQSLLDTQNRLFLQTIARARRTTPARLQTLLETAPVLDAEGALAAGLVDGVLDEAETERRLKRRLGVPLADRLPTVGARAYARTAPRAAGLAAPSADAEIAVVYAVGTIVEGESGTSANPLFGGEVVGDETFVAAMREAREDEQIRAVVLRIDSPGGSVSASEAMRREIARTAAVKPVVASMGGYAASGGYWIAAAADTIVADPLTLTGSIGVFGLAFNARGLFEDRLGITFDEVETAPFAGLGSAAGPLSPAELNLLQRSVDTTYARFLSIVAQSRGLTTAQVDSLAQGRVWTGEQARALGLVDRLGDFRVALDLAARRVKLDPDAVRLRVLPRPKTLTERLTERMSAVATTRVAAWHAGRLAPAERVLAEAAALLRALGAGERTGARAWLPVRLTIR